MANVSQVFFRAEKKGKGKRKRGKDKG